MNQFRFILSRTSIMVLASLQSIILVAPSCAQSTSTDTSKSHSTQLASFERFRKDPDAWKLLKDKAVLASMKKVMGRKISDYFDCTQLAEQPVIAGDNLTIVGGVRGLFTLTESVFNLNLKTGEACVGVLDIDKISVYGAQGGAAVPKPVREYLEDLASRKAGDKLSIVFAKPDLSNPPIERATATAKAPAPAHKLNIAKVTGEYKRVDGDTKFEAADLQVEKLEGDQIKFNLQASSGGHSGQASAVVPLKNNVAVYKNDCFKIEMVFSGKTVTVVQDGDGFGGIGVTATGAYEKTDDKVPSMDI